VGRISARGRGPRNHRPPRWRISSRLVVVSLASFALERRLTFSFLFSPLFRRAQIEEERRELDKALRSSVAREKLDGLKRLIGMMSTGRDVSQFFAAVVMNLAQDSFEVKVLVYIYLVRTAEQKADEALLSINSFQKDLAHPNPRVRALALRVMSSIRVDVIVPVVILAVRKCAVDVSPYVRKAAAHAIPKVYRLDKSRQHELVEIIETMLRDSTPFVLSSAVAAFQEVCPDRVDLIHRHFRKICRMLVDMDEWGQILMANLLTRYARAQFVKPDAYDRELTVDAVARGNQDGGERALALALPNESGGAFEKQSSNPLGNTAGFYSDSDSDSDSDASNASDESGSNADRGKKKAPKKASAAAAAGGAVRVRRELPGRRSPSAAPVLAPAFTVAERGRRDGGRGAALLPGAGGGLAQDAARARLRHAVQARVAARDAQEHLHDGRRAAVAVPDALQLLLRAPRGPQRRARAQAGDSDARVHRGERAGAAARAAGVPAKRQRPFRRAHHPRHRAMRGDHAADRLRVRPVSAGAVLAPLREGGG
jgi:hypothetical protein